MTTSINRGIAIVATILFVATVTRGEPNDPRCASHTCSAPPGFTNEDFPSDSSTCAYASCPQCLVGAEWDQRRAELGTGTASRSFEPSLVFGDWLSTELTETTFRILAEEMLGFTVDATATYVDGFDILCCDRNLVYMEKWEGEVYPNDEGYFSLSQLNNGYEGSSGLYVARHTLDAYPLATAANAYKYLSDYQNIFPKAFSTPCERLVNDDTNKTCDEAKYYCAENGWTNTTCVQGRYVPDQCKGALAADCLEVLHVDPNYESGFFEALIKNNGLKFVIAYVGYDNLLELVTEAQTTKQHLLFYAWEPDPMVNLVDAEPIVWKSPTAECRSKENSDPTLSGGDCDYGKRPLTKVMQTSRLELDPDFKFFFESFQLQSSDMRGMLREHVEGGGTKNVYNVSCDWLKANYVRWKDWIRNTPTASAKAEAASSSTGVIVAAVVAPVAVLLLGIVVVIGSLRARNAKAVANAPKSAPFTLIFTDVESSTMLWERHGADMAKAMEIHHSVIREAIEEHNCYEVKTIGDAFMIAGESLPDMVLLCVTIQRRLQAAQWPAALQNWKDADENVARLWRGLRVRIGVRYCLEAEPKFEAVNGRYDYYGHDVNMSARVESMARGGQILMTEDTYDALNRDADAALVTDEAAFYRFASGVELKGISEKQVMMCCVPNELKERHYEPIEGCPADDAGLAIDVTSTPSETHSQATGSQFGMNEERAEISRTIRLMFAGMKDVKERETVLASIAKQRGVDLQAGHTGRITFQRRLRLLIESMTQEIRGDGQPYAVTAVLPVSQPETPSGSVPGTLGDFGRQGSSNAPTPVHRGRRRSVQH